jgi:hypothetical protein
MTRALLLLLLLQTGCAHIQPVGPLADALPQRAKVKEIDDSVPEPVVRQAPKPTPPALYITPAEITSANAADAAKRLQQELETDRRALEAMPKFSEVSKVK